MQKYLLVLIILTGTNLFASAPDTLWTKTYGGNSNDYGNSVQQTSDSGFIITGWTYSFGAGDLDVYLVKTNSSGDTLWTRTFGGTNGDWGLSVQQTFDGGFIITGSTCSFGVNTPNFSNVYLVRTDSSGDTLWTRTFGETFDDYGNSVQQTQDSGFIIAEVTLSGVGYNDAYLIKTNSSGALLWTNSYGGTFDDYGYSVKQASDGGFIITGYTSSTGGDVYLIRTDSSGGMLWARTFGGTKGDCGNSVQQTKDGGFIVAGATTSFGTGNDDVYLIKTNSSGDTIWTRTYSRGVCNYGNSVQQTCDSGFIIAGTTNSFAAGISDSCDVYLVRTNSLGDTLWTKTLGGTKYDDGCSVQQTSDGGFIVVGITTSFGAGGSDVYLIRLGKETAVEENSNIKTQNTKLEISQNPFIKSTIIKYCIPVRTQVILSVYDISGSCVKTLINGEKEAGSYSINLKDLKTGVYFVRLTAGTFKETKKLVLMK
ncbi:MAG: T9SS type A sorting domain-containing protein [bacterium]|nr:T9SS type A sorting domain-containing protein [bacterium]